MAKNVKNTESKNNVNDFNNGQQYLINRMQKILEHPFMNEKLAEYMMKELAEWKTNAKERELKKINDEIARLTALKEELSK